MLSRTSRIAITTLAAVLAGVVVASASASSFCDPKFDVSPVTHALKYTGPQQRIHREGKMNFRCFNAQHWEDLYMFQNFLGNVTNGFFIELGALDGWSYSVSYFFEQFLNWRGLLIEASPKNYLQFKSKMRKLPAKRRRKSDYILSAVCNDPKPLTYVSKEGTGAGILEFMPEDQQIRNRKMCTEAALPLAGAAGSLATPVDPLVAAAAGSPNDCTLTKIQCVHLGNLLRERGVKKIDMFVLDVEGAELEVLSTLRLDEIPVHYFLIELDGKAADKDASVRCILRQHNYEPIGRLDLNEIWRKKDFDEAKYQDSYGPSVPIAAWSGCFKTPVDDSFFVSPLRRTAADALPGVAGGSVPDDIVRLDKDFDEFEVEGVARHEAHGGRGTTGRAIYGATPPTEGEAFNDLVSMFMWLLLLCVPITVILVRRGRTKKNLR